MMSFMRKNARGIMVGIVVVFIISCFAMYGPMGGGGGGGGTRDYAVAEVDGQKVMRSALENGVRNLAAQFGNMELSSADLPMVRKMVLDNIAVSMRLAKEAVAKDIKVTEDDVKKAIAEIEAQFPTKETFMQILEREGKTMDELKRDIKDQLAQQKLLESVTSAVSTDAKEIGEFYENMKEMFRRPAGYEVSMVVFRDNAQAKLAHAEFAANRKWNEMLEKFSADVSNSTKWEEPLFIGEQDLVGDMEFIKKLAKDSLSKVIEITSNDAAFVVKRADEAARLMKLEEVSADIRDMIEGQQRRDLQNKFINELKESSVIKILDEELFKAPEIPVVSEDAVSEDK